MALTKRQIAAQAQAEAFAPAPDGEVLPPDGAVVLEREDRADDLPDDGVAGKISGRLWRTKTRLQTPGQIKSELGRVYRKATSGQIASEEAVRLARVLLTMLKAAEIELEFQLRQDDPDDDRPTFAGLTLIGPSPKTPDQGTAAAPGTGGPKRGGDHQKAKG